MNGNSAQNAALTRQRRRLAQWLAEWRLEQTLAHADMSTGDDTVSARPSSAREWPLPAGSGAAPAAGQIRLMIPDFAPICRRPAYILITESLPSDEWLIAPFGILTSPAIPGEWRTGLRALPVRVLCVWNTRRVTRERLQRSWHVRNVDDRRLALARRLTADIFSWPASIRNRIMVNEGVRPVPANVLGPPLVHPLDPRRQYLTAESERMDALGPSPATVCGNVCWRGQPMPGAESEGLYYENLSESPLLKAAESRAGYSKSRRTRKNDLRE